MTKHQRETRQDLLNIATCLLWIVLFVGLYLLSLEFSSWYGRSGERETKEPNFKQNATETSKIFVAKI